MINLTVQFPTDQTIRQTLLGHAALEQYRATGLTGDIADLAAKRFGSRRVAEEDIPSEIKKLIIDVENIKDPFSVNKYPKFQMVDLSIFYYSIKNALRDSSKIKMKGRVSELACMKKMVQKNRKID